MSKTNTDFVVASPIRRAARATFPLRGKVDMMVRSKRRDSDGGIAGGLGATRLAHSLIFGVTPDDPWTFSFAAMVLALVALAACYIPARRASASALPMKA